PGEQSCQQQIADVGAGNQQQEHGSYRENRGRSVKLPQQLVLQRTRDEAETAKRIRMNVRKVPGQGSEIGLCIGYTGTRLQMTDAPKKAADVGFWAGKASHRVGKAERNPRVALVAVVLLVGGISRVPCRNAADREWSTLRSR